ncbi:MAG TPA: type II toxin-antitoxin system VapC family toxin [Beijerinckiaceae bacterium]|nr:type II toxin-antitoxin system VapC family toxin [Beijerinckiaceae bacterium]
MALRYMLDTNVFIRIRQRRPGPVLDRFQALGANEAVISVVSYGELCFGVEKGAMPDRALAALNGLVAFIPVQPLPPVAGAAYGSIRATLERRGETIGNNDLWIAAHALTAGLTLVTNNEREFRRVPGLSVENWAAD